MQATKRTCPYRLALLLALAIGLAGGCNRTGSDICPIRGRLTYRGQPIPQVFLRFEPDDLTHKSTSMAVTDASGNFEMFIGSTPGVYRGKVTVYCDDPLAAMGARTPVPKEVEAAYRELCSKYGAGKSKFQLTIDKPHLNLELNLE